MFRILKISITFALLFLSFCSHAAEHRVDIYDSSNYFSHRERNPGVDTWVENGKLNVTYNMPYCIFVLGEDFSQQQLQKFFDKIEVTSTVNFKEKPLSLTQFKGTWVYVDDDPEYGSFSSETEFLIKTKNGASFGQLASEIGATRETETISFIFDHGCKQLAVRPYLPKTLGVSPVIE
jgi:hypothetical protein